MSETTGIDRLIDFWREYTPNDEHTLHIHAQDLAWLKGRGYQEENGFLFNARCNAQPLPDRAFHLSLWPVPFLGDLRNAKCFLLFLNPVLTEGDYGDRQDARFCDAINANVQHEDREHFSFLGLDRNHSGSAWYDYYYKKLRTVVRKYAAGRKISIEQALDELSRQIALIQLVPYYSRRFDMSDGDLRHMPSAKAAVDAVQELRKKARAGKVLLVAVRGLRWWGLNEHNSDRAEHIICYERRGQARAACLNSNSEGGKAILRFLAPNAGVATVGG